jgi:putative oxidoreductase
MKKLINWFVLPPVEGPSSILLLRLMAGGVFFWEGMLKFIYTTQGVGRFTKLGFPFPETTSNFVATTEMIGGILILIGLGTRIVTLYFIFEMFIAILSTKISLYMGTSPLPSPAAPPQIGFWAVLHEVRSDYAQLLTCLFLFIGGAGKKSIDAVIARIREEKKMYKKAAAYLVR